MTTATELNELTRSDDIVHDTQALRRRADEDGYLFLPSLLGRDVILEMRRLFTAILRDIGWLKPGTNPMEAIAARSMLTENDTDYLPVFRAFQKLELFHTLPHDPRIIAVLDRLFGTATFPHPRNIGRIMFPDTPTTPPHQDYLHIRGTIDTWTAWIPMGDLPVELGGLSVIPGMHKRGLLPVVVMKGAGGAGIESHHLSSRWLTTNFRAGDVLLLHSLTPHASLPNRTGTRMRLSLDYRYQSVEQPVHPGSLKPHFGDTRITWPEIYANWKSDRYQYYWKNLPLKVSDADDPRAKTPASQPAASAY